VRLQSTDDVLYAVCSKERIDAHQPLVRPVPLAVPPLTDRAAELDRVISEYASDAIAELGVSPSSFTSDDHAWVRAHAANSLAEVEKATLRLTAIRSSPSASAAAARLGMSLVPLSRWIDRRRQLAHEGVAADIAGDRDVAPTPTAHR
jgi:DNA-binding transcriptional regulator YdaS (Cro superfamily)